MKRILLVGAMLLALQGCAVNVVTVNDANFTATTGGGWQEANTLQYKACQNAVGAIATEADVTAQELANPEVAALLDSAVQDCARRLNLTI